MNAGIARALVAGSSAAVLVLEILAGRLLAPYVGVSLETFTGIIGVVLAGIATGAWAGGFVADHFDGTKFIGAALAISGGLTWLVLPILGALGGQFGSGGTAIILLSLLSLFLPSAVLSAVSPMVTKLRLGDLGETGSIVGGLSAAGTLGALAGTFVTGFVLVQALPTRLTVIVLGAVLVLAGAATHAYFAKVMPTAGALLFVAVAALFGFTSERPCQTETTYFCANIVVDADNPSGRSLYLDGLRHAYVDLEDPTTLDIRYVRIFSHTAAAVAGGPLDTLHIGGGGFSFPRYLDHVRPGSTELVIEIDEPLIALVQDELGLEPIPGLQIEAGDARLALRALPDGRFDMAFGDAFGGKSVPWHLTTQEFLQEVDRVLADDGIYVMNVIDGSEFNFSRAELATLQTIFAHVAVIAPQEGIGNRPTQNLVLVASQQPLPEFVIPAEDGALLPATEQAEFVGDTEALRDDYAPVDQMLD